MSQPVEMVESDTVREFRAEMRRLQGERDAKAQEMRTAANQLLVGKINESRKEARRHAESLRQLEDSQQQDREDMRRMEIDLSLQANPDAERLAIQAADSLQIRTYYSRLSVDIKSLTRSVDDLEKLVASVVRMRKPEIAKSSMGIANVHMNNIARVVLPISERLLAIARGAPMDEKYNERMDCLTRIHRKTFHIADNTENIKKIWEGSPSEQWLQTLERAVKENVDSAEIVTTTWAQTPKM